MMPFFCESLLQQIVLVQIVFHNFLKVRDKRAIPYIDVVEEKLEQQALSQKSTDVPVTSTLPFVHQFSRLLRSISTGRH